MYEIDVRCTEGEMNVTSDHLTMIPPDQWDTDSLEEPSAAEDILAKRGKNFGIPAGPGMCTSTLHRAM
jgi:DNA-directed RNA polymerase II subunit RPB3